MRVLLAILLLAALAGGAARIAKAQDGMVFTLTAAKSSYRAGEPILLTWQLTNRTNQSWLLLSHMDIPGRRDFDPITIDLHAADGHELGKFELMGKRTAVRPVVVAILPGETLKQSFDLLIFAGLNGFRMGPGTYRVTAEYHFQSVSLVPADKRNMAWTARLSSPPLQLVIREGD